MIWSRHKDKRIQIKNIWSVFQNALEVGLTGKLKWAKTHEKLVANLLQVEWFSPGTELHQITPISSKQEQKTVAV